MVQSTLDITAFNYGHLSPKLRGRVDLDWHKQSLDYMLNYVSTPQGELALRGGSSFVAATKGNKKARLIPFIYNTEQSYVLELTNQAMRVYKDHGVVTLGAKTITAITKAAAGQVTAAGHGYSVGQPIILSGIFGMTQLNNREVAVASVVDANNFTINVNTTGYDTYTSGGSASAIAEFAVPFLEAELDEVDYTQTNNTMYLVHKSYAPQKLTRSSHTSWTCTSYDISANPFGTTKAAAKTITGITQANPAVVTSAGHGYSNGKIVYISGVVGMTDVNGKRFTVRNVAANTYELEGCDSSTYDAYTSGGTSEEYTAFSYPSIVTLFERRLCFAASDSYPTKIWMSQGGQLDSFVTGTLDTDALEYTVAADQANRIRWMAGSESYLAFGTSGSEFRIAGGGENGAITPTNISVKPTSFNGVAAVRPIRLDSYIMYVQRNSRTVRSFEYNALQDGYTSPDRTLLADHITKGRIKAMSYTAGTPNIIWSITKTGQLLGLTFDPSQQVIAWHGHKTDGLFLSITSIPEENDDDELWAVIERTINGQTVRYVEYFPNNADMPAREEYFTADTNKDADDETYLTALWDYQRKLLYADSALIYDGRDGATVNLTITGDLEAGEVVTVTASSSFFTAQHATDRRRIQTPGGGQIEITGYTSGTVVTGLVRYDLEASSFASGTWYWMAQSLSGLMHIEGVEAAILSDGGIIENKTVSAGKITLDEDAGYVIVGIPYHGIGKTQDLAAPGQQGRTNTKPRNASSVSVFLRSSIGTKFGTDIYAVQEPAYRISEEVAGRPPRLFNGTIRIDMPDGWNIDKNLYFVHDKPTPSNIQLITLDLEANET